MPSRNPLSTSASRVDAVGSSYTPKATWARYRTMPAAAAATTTARIFIHQRCARWAWTAARTAMSTTTAVAFAASRDPSDTDSHSGTRLA